MSARQGNRPVPGAPGEAVFAPRNPGVVLDLDWVASVRVNRSAVERRTATLTRRRSVKQAWQAAWQLRAITCLDLTSLSGDDTPGRIRRLCAKARRPVRREVLAALGLDTGRAPCVASVCVHHPFIETALDALRGSSVAVCVVSAGFPTGLSPMAARLAEIGASCKAGAQEIDVVITRGHVLTGAWQRLYDEVRTLREACGPLPMKVILSTGDLGPLGNVARAALVAMMAGADFVKTSTGKESENATLPVGLVMARAIRAYRERTDVEVGLKPAGGIGRARQALAWLTLVKEELGDAWLAPSHFRLGASGLLTDLERQLEHRATGRYAAAWRQPRG